MDQTGFIARHCITSNLLELQTMFLTSVSKSANSTWTLVLREVRATSMRVSRSISFTTFTSSSTSRALSLAASKPSAITLGWRPCRQMGVTFSLRKKINRVRNTRSACKPQRRRGLPAWAALRWSAHWMWCRLRWCHPGRGHFSNQWSRGMLGLLKTNQNINEGVAFQSNGQGCNRFIDRVKIHVNKQLGENQTRVCIYDPGAIYL